jgi:glutamine amidotransferase
VIGIVDYGAGNLQSVKKAVCYLGEKTIVSAETRQLDGCSRLILPGVGSFGAGIAALRARGLDAYLLTRVKDTPLLGICLGMQFLLAESEEEGSFTGLGLAAGKVSRFMQGKVPHVGWNGVYGLSSPLFYGIEEGAQFYFVHSYFADVSANTIARTEYFRSFSSAVKAGNAYGVQFHPEKSGDTGLRLLRNFMRI